jgi:hypothetical protein
MQPTREVLIDFAGDGEGVDELSWGQSEIWQAMVDQKSALPIGGIGSRPGISVDAVADELRYLMGRFQSMRTRIVFADDGRPLQSLSAKGRITLAVFEAGGEDPDELASKVHADYVSTPFDPVGEWPVRMAVVCRDGLVIRLIAVMSHLTTDGQGGAIMLGEVHRRAPEPVDGMQPLEQARWQRSPEGVRQNEAAMRHFARQLDRIPLGMLNDRSGAGKPRYVKAKLRSPALEQAVRRLSASIGAHSSAVLIALYAMGFARVTGHPVFFTRPVVSNRFRARLSNVVCMLAQAGLCVIDVADSTTTEVIRRTQRAALTAYKNAYFDPRRLAALLAQTAQRRGPLFSASCFFNDRRGSGLPGELPDPARIAAARAQTTFRWVPEPEKICDRLALCVEDVPGLIELTVDFDTHYVSPRTVEAMLHAMEEVAVAEATAQTSRQVPVALAMTTATVEPVGTTVPASGDCSMT